MVKNKKQVKPNLRIFHTQNEGFEDPVIGVGYNEEWSNEPFEIIRFTNFYNDYELLETHIELALELIREMLSKEDMQIVELKTEEAQLDKKRNKVSVPAEAIYNVLHNWTGKLPVKARIKVKMDGGTNFDAWIIIKAVPSFSDRKRYHFLCEYEKIK